MSRNRRNAVVRRKIKKIRKIAEALHQGESDFEVKLIDQAATIDEHKLDTWQPNALNEYEIALI